MCDCVSVLLGQDGWSVKYITQSICVLKGSTVDLSCSYTYPSGTVTTTFCFTRNDAEENPVSLSDEPDYTGHVTYCSNKKNGHTLTIRSERERLSYVQVQIYNRSDRKEI
jgi:hypothetical protein